MNEAARPPSYRQQVLSSFSWQAGGQAAGQALSWMVSLVVVRILSPGDYGLMATAGVFVGLLTLIADLGLGASAIQAEKLDRAELGSLATVVYAVNGSAFLLTVLGAPLIAAAFAEPRLVPILRVLSLTFLLSAAYVLPQSLLARELRFREKASVEVTATMIASLAALGVALAGGGVWSLVTSFLVLHGLKAIVFNYVAHTPLLPRWSPAAVRPHLRFGSLVMFDRIAYYLWANADIVIGGRVLGRELLGLYSIALNLASIPLDKVLPAVTQVSFAAFSRIQSERDRVTRNLLLGVRIAGLFSFPAFLGLAVVAPDFVLLVLGEKWLGVVVPLQLLCLALPLKSVTVLLPPALFAIGRPGVNLGNMILALVIMTPAFMIGVQSGVAGLAMAWVVTFPGVFLVTTYRALSVIGVPARKFTVAVLLPAMAALVMAGAAALVRSRLPAGTPLVLRLVLTVLAGVAAYLAALVPARRHVLADLATVRGR